tara:strand:+ start:574 stop:708 length:135 start_codon:yes stop_codon:yes gene_type:complete
MKKIQERDKAKSGKNGPVIKKIGIDRTKKLTILNSNLLIKSFLA